MKFLDLFLILILVMGAVTPVFAHPIQYEDNYLTISLKTPDYYITTSNFDEQKITVNMTFENNNSGQSHGLTWDMTPITNATLNYDEIYKNAYDSRTIAVIINDITNGTKVKLDDNSFKINSDYNLRKLSGHSYGEYLPLEILDIEQNVVGSHDKKSSLKFEFTLESSEFELDRKYEMDLSLTETHSHFKTFEFVDRNKKSEPASPSTVNSSTDTKIDTDGEREEYNESNIQSQQTLQAEEAIKKHAEILAQKELEEQQKLKKANKVYAPNVASVHCADNGGTLEIFADENGSQYGMCTLTDGTQCGEWKYFRGECKSSVLVPEPIIESMEEEKKCGAGTEIVDGYCKVVTNNESTPKPIAEQNGFLDWLMSLFGI